MVEKTIDLICFYCEKSIKRPLWHYRMNIAKGHKIACSRTCISRDTAAKRKTTKENVLSLIDKTPGHGPDGTCWKWTGGINAYGYGVTSFGVGEGGRKGRQPAHRAVYSLLKKEVSMREGVIRHHCDNPICVNPDHLELGTTAENVQDMIDRNRISRGSKHVHSVMSEDTAMMIKYMHYLGYSQKHIKEYLKTPPVSTFKIVHGQGWKHLPNVNKEEIPKSLLEKYEYDKGNNYIFFRRKFSASYADINDLLSKGHTINDVAGELGVSLNTVRRAIKTK